MALQALLKIDGKTYDVQNLDFQITQPADSTTGKPTAIAEGGIMNFQLLANNKDQFFFQKWVLSIADRHNGEFLLPITDGIEHDIMIIKFENAYCTDLHFHYTYYNDKQLYLGIKITPTKIIFDPQVEFVNKKIDTSK